ncbi:MAG TPA: hypothetical protein VHU15_04475 [Stellaceae bacterium]|nr:hypothetical protein [Stellaceae bacterium]
MPHLRTALLAVIAACGMSGVSGLALAQSPQTLRNHVMTVALPDGGTAQIRYTGDVPPQVVFGSGPAAPADWAPLPALFGSDSAFAMLEHISAEMDRRAAAMFRQAASLTTQAQSGEPQSAQAIEAALRNLPPGSSSYSYVSTISGNGVCSQSVEITSTGDSAPKVVRHSSGNCGPETGAPGSVNALGNVPARLPNRRPDTLWIKDSNPAPYRGLVQKTSSPQ